MTPLAPTRKIEALMGEEEIKKEARKMGERASNQTTLDYLVTFYDPHESYLPHSHGGYYKYNCGKITFKEIKMQTTEFIKYINNFDFQRSILFIY